MATRAIPSSGEMLPVIGCGTYRGFDVPISGLETLGNVVATLIDGDAGMLDTSPMYDKAEANLGRVLFDLQARPRTFIATKVWTRGRRAGIAQMEQSLQLLRTDHVDLMQVHNLVDAAVHLDTLAGWKADGRTRYVGVTHYHNGAYRELEDVMRRHRLDFVQLNYSLADRVAEERILPLAKDRGIAVIINMPFGGGRFLKMIGEEPLPPFASDIGCATWSQVLLKFAIGHEAVTCAIPGTGNPAHMAANLVAGRGDLVEDRRHILDWWDGR
ncbi:aldo/keto reductase [Novosphingobium sp. BL-52-GroH]|uniref:aldo/keto reductase n=1 Tax=Novosphingobium sp. BL-52-GroH TaxID=3349877 RepID=UPI003850B945